MGERLRRQLRAAPPSENPAPSRWLLGDGRCGIRQDDLLNFVAHGVALSYRGPDAMHIVVVLQGLKKFSGMGALLAG